MPVDKPQAQMLATLAVACRPHGAPRWDEAGTLAAIAKVRHLALADVAHAVIRAAEDRDARTPAVIASTASLHWRETRTDRPAPLIPGNAETCCHKCGKVRERHAAADHEFLSTAEWVARRGEVDAAGWVQRIRQDLACEEPRPELEPEPVEPEPNPHVEQLRDVLAGTQEAK